MTMPSSLLEPGSSLRLCAALLLLALGAPLGGCTQPESETCSTGIVCPIGSKCSGDGKSCIYNNCGDGQEQEGEVCDDGNNVDGDGCSADCSSTEGCGDNIVNTTVGEVCDDGNNEDRDGCSANCRSTEECGNEIVDAHEMCDDGNNVSGDGCRADCLSDETCGNGVVDYHLDERCDPGLTPDQCSDDCTSNLECGNGIVDVEAGEECDDGENDDNTDDCTRTTGRLCRLAYCGDGFIRTNPTHPEDAEQCDDGGPSEACNPDCTPVEQVVDGSPKGCGDGIVNTALGEKCDDGENNGQHGYCNRECNGPLECGDGIVTLPELCDPNHVSLVLTSSGQPAQCRDDCTGYEDYCGDGRLSPGEACDNGSANSDLAYNGCNSQCQIGLHCGDGSTDGPEECDNNTDNVVSPIWQSDHDVAQCSLTCSIGPYCGDGALQTEFEACEPENVFSVATPKGPRNSPCHEDCSGYCGDHVENPAEGCDSGPFRYGPGGSVLGNGADGDGAHVTSCRSDCSRCGDNTLNTARGETCDEGENNSASNARTAQPCRRDCSRCGDGVVQDGTNETSNRGETCDEGENNSTGTTTMTACRVDCTMCGDGILQHNETCDEGENNSSSTTTMLLCRANCTKCGDGAIQAPEACDDGEHNNVDVAYSLAKTCSTGCTINPHCGDNLLQGAETCDYGASNSTSNAGSISGCRANCTRCGDGILQTGEQCDLGIQNGLPFAPCTFTCLITIPSPF